VGVEARGDEKGERERERQGGRVDFRLSALDSSFTSSPWLTMVSTIRWVYSYTTFSASQLSSYSLQPAALSLAERQCPFSVLAGPASYNQLMTAQANFHQHPVPLGQLNQWLGPTVDYALLIRAELAHILPGWVIWAHANLCLLLFSRLESRREELGRSASKVRR
jgi:hypothetical protein